MRKKIATVLLAAAITCSFLSGCSDSGAPAPSTSTPTSSAPAASSPATTDKNEENSSSTSAPSQVQVPNTNEVKNQTPKVEGLGFYCVPSSSSSTYRVYYSYKITNPNTSQSTKYIRLEEEIYNASGNVVDTESFFLPKIAANDTVYVSGYHVVKTGEELQGIKYRVATSTYSSFEDQNESKIPSSSQLIVSNLYRPSGSDKITGIVKNTGKKTVDLKVCAFYKCDNQIYGGDYSYVYSIAPGQSSAFEISTSNAPSEFDSYMVYASVSL